MSPVQIRTLYLSKMIYNYKKKKLKSIRSMFSKQQKGAVSVIWTNQMVIYKKSMLFSWSTQKYLSENLVNLCFFFNLIQWYSSRKTPCFPLYGAAGNIMYRMFGGKWTARYQCAEGINSHKPEERSEDIVKIVILIIIT